MFVEEERLLEWDGYTRFYNAIVKSQSLIMNKKNHVLYAVIAVIEGIMLLLLYVSEVDHLEINLDVAGLSATFIMFKSQDTTSSSNTAIAASIVASILGLLYLRRKLIAMPLSDDEKLERDLLNECNLSPCRPSSPQ